MDCFAGCLSFLGAVPPVWGSAVSLLEEEYSVGRALGTGAFGTVYAGVERKTGKDVAVKVMDTRRVCIETVKVEVAFLRHLSHRNIVRLHEFLVQRRHAFVVMDRFAGGDLVEGLQRHIRQDKGLAPCQAFVHIGAQMAAAVHYLHAQSIVHRDVKGDNFMVDRADIFDRGCRVALGDFGTACMLREEQRLNTPLGTKLFWAPEFFQLNYSFKVDVWAVGVVTYGLCAHRFPFRDEVDVALREPAFPRSIGPACKDFIRSALEKRESWRADAAELAAHRWVCEADFEGRGGGAAPAHLAACRGSGAGLGAGADDFASVTTASCSSDAASDSASSPFSWQEELEAMTSTT